MDRSARSNLFHQELNRYRLIAERHQHWLAEQPLWDKHLTFWFESARFLITELEIWEDLRNYTEYDETANKVQKVLDYIHQLMTRLAEEDTINNDQGYVTD